MDGFSLIMFECTMELADGGSVDCEITMVVPSDASDAEVLNLLVEKLREEHPEITEITFGDLCL